MLYRLRNKINPPDVDRLDKLRIRKDDPDLQHLSFLFSCYSPDAYLFEIFDSYRRIIMQGVLTFAGIGSWETVRVSITVRSRPTLERRAVAQGPAVVGIILALLSSVIFRETEPYDNPSTNVLANIAQMQLLATYLVAYMLLTELYEAPDPKVALWGTLLLLINLGTVVLAVVLQIAEANRKTVVQLMLLEREIR